MLTSNKLMAGATLFCLLALSACNKPAGESASNNTETIPAASTASQSVELQVIGMHCDNCVQSIQGTVAKMEGVSAVSANFETGVVDASFDPAKVSEQQISAEIESLGFSVPGRVGSPEAEAALAEKAAKDAEATAQEDDAGADANGAATETEGSDNQAPAQADSAG
ncbi:heavy-metal-associated domain-containing protein [bacterium]|nr:heavy-metal-associated domain-containing protein [bacterium]